ncbi:MULTISPECIES: acyl-CoA dehydrogenase family protein [Massilia]|uniref:Acyl-CoA dehydrogenase family protein n=1 Tax=Massilia haematophila TaxID=457923 RepID=A0ABV7PKJ7_9BURK|nr:acyl-CoA dehydrogenase family protein [Massilia sp.]HBZ04914.1 acyl-CoA dehydrogenase [Massilia sp.]
MALVLNQEQDMLRESALQFMKERAPVAQLRALRDARNDDGFSRDLWASFAEMGFTGVLVPEAHGGLGLGMMEAGAIMEAIGRNLTAVPFFSTAVLGASLLARHGSADQQGRWLPLIARGEAIVALAIDEAAKHRPDRIGLRARRDGDGYLLDGEKLFVVDGHVADLLVVAARTDEGSIALFLVEGAAAGLRRERSIMADAHNAARLVFDGVRVGPDTVLGEGAKVLGDVLDIGRAALAAELLGIADEVFERTQSYLKERRQFGQIIGEFQALQHRSSALYCDIELTRAIVLGAQQALDEGSSNAAALVSAAKSRAGPTATTAVQEGVQMHGGIGMTDEFEIGFFMKRARVVEELLGDARFHADRWARLSGY